MADNVPITAGTGTDIATDEVTTTGEHVQLFKLAVSADGERVLVPATAADGLLVNVSQIGGSLPAGTNMIGKVDLSDGVNDAVIDVTGADAESSTTASLVTAARMKVFNGTSWDRVRGDITNGIDVDVTRINGQVTIGDGTNAVSVDTSGTDAEGNVNQLHVQSRSYEFNGSTWDRKRNTSPTNKVATYTTAQTGAALWTPAAGRGVVITAIQIQSYGTTAGTAQVWFGGAADTTYTRGTDEAIFDGEFAPSATNKPGVFTTFPFPPRGDADFVLRVTTTNAQSITVNVWGYEI